MKKYYLSRSRYNEEYFLDCGSYDSNREHLGNLEHSDLVKKLKGKIDLKRKSVIFVEKESFFEEIRSLESFFEGSKVKLAFIENIREI
jgi:hypothetical protein